MYVLVERIYCIVHESMVESWTSMFMVSKVEALAGCGRRKDFLVLEV